MNRKYVYWAATGLLSLLYLASTTMYLMNADTVGQSLEAFGYPAYLREVLITVKLLGIAAILSRVSVALSDLAYAGMFFHLLLALLAHVAAADGGFAPALIGLVLLTVSFATQNAARIKPSPYPPLAST